MSLLIAAYFLKLWNQTGHSHSHFSIDWSLRFSAVTVLLFLTVCCQLQTRFYFPDYLAARRFLLKHFDSHLDSLVASLYLSLLYLYDG
jgi:hypothetical protein